MRPIHQEHMHAVVLGEVADAEVLPVAREVREGEGALVEYAEESRRAAAMLHIGPALAARCGHEEAVAFADIADELGRERVARGRMVFQSLRIGARAVPALRLLDGGRER